MNLLTDRSEYIPDAERLGETGRLRLQRETEEPHNDAGRTDDQRRRSRHSWYVSL